MDVSRSNGASVARVSPEPTGGVEAAARSGRFAFLEVELTPGGGAANTVAPNVSPATQAVAQALVEFKVRHPQANVAALLGQDAWRLARRESAVLLPTAGTFVLGFCLGQAFSTQAGFNRILPVRSYLFNPLGGDHRGNGAALIGCTLAIGIAGSIGLSVLGTVYGKLQQAMQGPHLTPASPLADLFVGDIKGLLGRHGRGALCTFLAVLVGFVAPQCVMDTAAFNFLEGTVSPPFNRATGPNRTLASALLGFDLAAQIACAVAAYYVVGPLLSFGIGKAVAAGSVLGARIGQGLRAAGLRRPAASRGAQ